MEYKVLITTSGTGSRLGELTKYTNKALVRIGKKPAISYIIEAYPKEIPLVITIGYLKEQVQEFLILAYPDRKFEFVEVDKYEGEGSSLGYSMLQAEKKLQCPFIFHSCDTIVTENIPKPEENWVGGYMVDKVNTDLQLDQYRTHKLDGEKVVSLKEKGDPDFESIHIGLIGVKDYAEFWKNLKEIYSANLTNTGHSDVHVVDKMIKNDIKFKLAPFNDWYDTGNPLALKKTRKALGKDFDILDKAEESVYIFDDFVIKFFYNSETVKKRVARAKILAGLVPAIIGSANHFYKYEFIAGDLYSRVVDADDFAIFLKWAKDNLWLKKDAVDSDQFKQACLKFYKNKTEERVKDFFEAHSIKDGVDLINDEEVPSIQEILNKIDFAKLCPAEEYRIHGDFILDNILKTKGGYCLLDWRQDFGGLIDAGDMYYDLAKMNHNLTVNHDLINEGKFKIDINGNKISVAIDEKENLFECKKILESFVKNNNWDWQRVNLLTGLVWLNMSPLHHDPFNKFLFYSGKLKVWQTLSQK